MNKHNWWLSIAESDLQLAKKGAEEDSTLSIAIIHTQQCAEKSLKGYLSYHSRPLQRTHDLLKLLDDCVAIDDSFVVLRNSAAILTPYATEFRYPGEEEAYGPSLKLMNAAILHAMTILDFVKEKLSILPFRDS